MAEMGVTLADERARQRNTKLRPKPGRESLTLPGLAVRVRGTEPEAELSQWAIDD
jgi:hypothetical protein